MVCEPQLYPYITITLQLIAIKAGNLKDQLSRRHFVHQTIPLGRGIKLKGHILVVTAHGVHSGPLIYSSTPWNRDNLLSEILSISAHGIWLTLCSVLALRSILGRQHLFMISLAKCDMIKDKTPSSVATHFLNHPGCKSGG